MLPPPSSLPALLETAKAAALEAGSAILEIYESQEFGVVSKADQSPLTRADQAAHAVIARHLATTGLPLLSEEGAQIPYPERASWAWYWLVDPLDGTKEFIKKNGEFTVNLALMHQCQPVAGVIYAPCLGSLYWGSRQTGVYKELAGTVTPLQALPAKRHLPTLRQQTGVRIIASRTHLTPETEAFIGQFPEAQRTSMGSSLKFMLLAEQKASLYPRFAPTMEWDTAAAHALLNALNQGIYHPHLAAELTYNKPDLLNPSFIAL
nr:3'(2'),5'-bisphosphate nucleotidase CysQ [Rufibacter sp. SYSU D00308]